MTDDTTDPSTPDVDADAGADIDAAPTRRRRSALLAVLVVALLVASGVALWQTTRLADAEDDADRRTDAARTAGEFAVALLSYDFEALDDQVERITELATDDFAAEFDDAMDQGLGASIEELRARSSASVDEVLVSEAPGDRARAIVIADSEITSEAGSRANTDTYLDVSLVHLDGRWQVDDVRTVATGSPPDPEADGGADPEADGGAGDADDTGTADDAGDVGDDEPAG